MRLFTSNEKAWMLEMNGGVEVDEVGYEMTWDESDLYAIRYAWE
jgi:hypothetical protein